jgi:carboxypeptidase Taq
MEANLQELKTRLMEASDLDAAGAVLAWDQATYMPPGGGEARGRQLALLGRLQQERSTDPALGRLLEALKPYEESQPFDSDEAALIRVSRREFERALRLPPEFVGRLLKHQAESYQAWAAARPANNFAAVAPYLEKTIELSREYASYFPGIDHPADPLIDRADEGMTANTVSALFTGLRSELAPLARAITSLPPADDSCLRQHFPEAGQLQFSTEVIRDLGYDFERGRQDKTHHPFMIKFSLGDVRITTRVREDFLGEMMFSTIHEAGHAMYEQGVRMELEGTPLAGGASSGAHESQSRLWENIVGRSLGFWKHYYPKLQAVFPAQLGNVSLDTFHRAINKVEKSLIRTDADEVTYNLHVMIRFDLELALLEGRLTVKDLPEAWNARYESDLGLRPPDDRNGVLQDMHWYYMVVGGMFQGYTLGNIMGAQFYAKALQAHPEIPAEMEQGKFSTLLGWMRAHVHQHGRKYSEPELIARVTGGSLDTAPYMAYLRGKYGALYGL